MPLQSNAIALALKHGFKDADFQRLIVTPGSAFLSSCTPSSETFVPSSHTMMRLVSPLRFASPASVTRVFAEAQIPQTGQFPQVGSILGP